MTRVSSLFVFSLLVELLVEAVSVGTPAVPTHAAVEGGRIRIVLF